MQRQRKHTTEYNKCMITYKSSKVKSSMLHNAQYNTN